MTCQHELELESLRRAITRQREFSPELGLWAGEARMLALLYKRPACKPEALSAVYSGNAESSSNESIRVGISRMRRKLPAGVGIHHSRGSYRLTGKDILKDYIIRI